MKTKIDFTTNSSSESFILNVSKPVKGAKRMLEIFFNNWKKNHEGKVHPQERRVMKWIKENPDFKGNIIIPWTSNYITSLFTGKVDWIDKAMGRRVVVYTCNNELWEVNGLEIVKYLNPEETKPRPSTKFLDLIDFRVKTKRQFDIEENERFNEEIKILREKRKEERKESENKNQLCNK